MPEKWKKMRTSMTNISHSVCNQENIEHITHYYMYHSIYNIIIFQPSCNLEKYLMLDHYKKLFFRIVIFNVQKTNCW